MPVAAHGVLSCAGYYFVCDVYNVMCGNNIILLLNVPLFYSDSSYSEPTDSPTPSPPPAPDNPSGPLGRTFECVCWELDPHLCLLSSAGTGQFNPHISWLLERLGLEHARTTIPKWIQRVAMDPLDMVVANVVELLIKLTATKKLKLRASSPPPEQFN